MHTHAFVSLVFYFLFIVVAVCTAHFVVFYIPKMIFLNLFLFYFHALFDLATFQNIFENYGPTTAEAA